MYTLFTKENCSYCKKAKDLLDFMGEDYITHDITEGTNRQIVNERAGYEIKTVPQIWHDDTHIGGFTELSKYIG